jgi:hypothetical protein
MDWTFTEPFHGCIGPPTTAIFFVAFYCVTFFCPVCCCIGLPYWVPFCHSYFDWIIAGIRVTLLGGFLVFIENRNGTVISMHERYE